MPRPRKNKMYFTQDTENAIIEYNKSNNQKIKNQLYREQIKYPFEKLAENVLNTFKFSYFDVPKEDVQMEVVAILIQKIHMFKEGKGKAFSYFSIVAKNYLILNNNSTKISEFFLMSLIKKISKSKFYNRFIRPSPILRSLSIFSYKYLIFINFLIVRLYYHRKLFFKWFVLVTTHIHAAYHESYA